MEYLVITDKMVSIVQSTFSLTCSAMSWYFAYVGSVSVPEWYAEISGHLMEWFTSLTGCWINHPPSWAASGSASLTLITYNATGSAATSLLLAKNKDYYETRKGKKQNFGMSVSW